MFTQYLLGFMQITRVAWWSPRDLATECCYECCKRLSDLQRLLITKQLHEFSDGQISNQTEIERELSNHCTSN